jgi:hypothetical protein
MTREFGLLNIEVDSSKQTINLILKEDSVSLSSVRAVSTKFYKNLPILCSVPASDRESRLSLLFMPLIHEGRCLTGAYLLLFIAPESLCLCTHLN